MLKTLQQKEQIVLIIIYLQKEQKLHYTLV